MSDTAWLATSVVRVLLYLLAITPVQHHARIIRRVPRNSTESVCLCALPPPTTTFVVGSGLAFFFLVVAHAISLVHIAHVA